MNLADLQRLAEAGPEALARVVELAGRLAALDKERAGLVAELEAFGVSAAPPTGPIAADPVAAAPDTPLCVACGKPGSVTVDGEWYCEPHDPTERA